jgi:hypothetical protein
MIIEPEGHNHPESVDPFWFQELVRRAHERETRRFLKLITAEKSVVTKSDYDEAEERAMWYVFELRNNLTELWYAGNEHAEGEI